MKNLCLGLICQVAFFPWYPITSWASEIIPDQELLILSREVAILKVIVIDRDTNQPIPYANVFIIDKEVVVQTNLKGELDLKVGPGVAEGKLRVTSLGYTSQEFRLADLIRQTASRNSVKLFLVPDYKSLQEIEVKAKSRKWRGIKEGFHIDKGTSFAFEFYPSDTLIAKQTGPEIGTKIHLKKYPASLRSASFGLAGAGGERLLLRIHLYSLKNNLPHRNLLPESAIVVIPSYHTGWITVNLQQYNITLKEDFAVVVEWLTQTNDLNFNQFMAFATIPKGQIIYYRDGDLKPWEIVNSTPLDVKSIGMYVTYLFKK